MRGGAYKDVSLNDELQGFTSIKMDRKIYEKNLEECLGGGFTSVRMETPTALSPEC